MNAITDDRLRIAVRLFSTPLDELRQTTHEWNLGTVSIRKDIPLFRVGFGHELSTESRFYKVPFDFGDDVRGIAVVFRAFDPARESKQTAEYVVGWVPPDREHVVDEWLRTLNDEIARRISAASNA